MTSFEASAGRANRAHASLRAVRDLAEELLGAEDRIDVLVANAGIGGGARQESADGYELRSRRWRAMRGLQFPDCGGP